jgi:uncharacterized protein YkwD
MTAACDACWPTPGGDFDPDFETDLHDLGDIFRRGQGLSPAAPDPGLTLAARAHAADIARTGCSTT